MNSTPRPIFIFSLPRSGSTLLQRIIAAHPLVASAPEPWLLLPFCYALREQGGGAEYDSALGALALREFAEHLDGGVAAYGQELRSFALALYARAARGKPYFLDKTPRYHLIASEIMDMFPEGRFVFLWRNPLAIVASMVQTWQGGRFHLSEHTVDLFKGLASLTAAHAANRERCLALRYEDLVMDIPGACKALSAYLELDITEETARGFASVRLDGAMGDPTGSRRYARIEPSRANAWMSVIDNPLRRRWARNYLDWIGDERLAAMGYSRRELLLALRGGSVNWSSLTRDMLHQARGHARRVKRLGALPLPIPRVETGA